jgi:hypothetical protein
MFGFRLLFLEGKNEWTTPNEERAPVKYRFLKVDNPELAVFIDREISSVWICIVANEWLNGDELKSGVVEMKREIKVRVSWKWIYKWRTSVSVDCNFHNLIIRMTHSRWVWKTWYLLYIFISLQHGVSYKVGWKWLTSNCEKHLVDKTRFPWIVSDSHLPMWSPKFKVQGGERAPQAKCGLSQHT